MGSSGTRSGAKRCIGKKITGRGPTRRPGPDARLPASALPSPDVVSIGAGRKIFFLKFFAFLGQEKSLSFLSVNTSSGTRSGAKRCIGKKIMGRGPTRRRGPDARLPASAVASPDVSSIGAGRKNFFLK